MSGYNWQAITTALTDLKTALGRITTLENATPPDVSAFVGRLGEAELAIAAVQSAATALTARVAALETGLSELQTAVNNAYGTPPQQVVEQPAQQQ